MKDFILVEFIHKLLSLVLSSLLGEKLSFKETNKFSKRFYGMILAIKET